MPAQYSGHPWTDRQIQILVKGIREGRSTSEIARSVRRTASAVRSKASFLGISLSKSN
jgi:DNA-binding NarL/FixJ family response regulator